MRLWHGNNEIQLGIDGGDLEFIDLGYWEDGEDRGFNVYATHGPWEDEVSLTLTEDQVDWLVERLAIQLENRRSLGQANST